MGIIYRWWTVRGVREKIFFAKIFFAKIFSTKNIFSKNIFGTKIFSPEIFLSNIFSPKNKNVFKNIFKKNSAKNIFQKIIVNLREREGQRVDLGRSLKGHLLIVDGGYPFPDALH